MAAARREKDPKRVPNLGISDPISHVRTQTPTETAIQVISSGNQSSSEMNKDTTRNLESVKNGMYAKSVGKHIDFVNQNSGKSEPIKINSNK